MCYIFSENSYIVIRKVICIVLFIPLACSTPPVSDEELIVPDAMKLTTVEITEEMKVASGMMFTVEDFDTWMNAYGDVAEGLIIAFRNVDAPNMTLVFEGSPSLAIAEKRIEMLSSEDFLSTSSAFGEPISSFYKIEYVKTVPNPPTHFFALSYPSGGDPAKDWLKFVIDNEEFFKELEIEPAGIGTDPDQSDRAYLLFRQFDFITLRKALNSPKKRNKFLDRLGLPDETMISYWIRISQSAE